MSYIDPNKKKILKKVLEPLLEDFQYWFSRTRKLLEDENILFLSPDEQNEFLIRVKNAQQEVKTAKMMFQATGCEVGVDMSVVIPWHQLLRECWQIAFKWRTQQS